MNQRIRQLAEQACAFADIQYNKQTKATFYTNKSVEEFFREKFAELIVQECVKLQYKNVVVGGVSDYNRGRRELAEEIKQHFGVEE